MTAMYQGENNTQEVVRERNNQGRIAGLKQGSIGPTMSDLEFEMENERKQHEDAYKYAHGSHVGETVPLGQASF